ncbi:MAG TPA: hypothetical protein VHG32_08980 [Thermoanaerobaculia bacterium]|jgi:hypothetical protein|nr:hypothetical protein [Thermoanaerobaculia bacterium]
MESPGISATRSRSTTRLLRAVDAAIERALPADWPRVPQHRLPVHGDVRVRHCFRRSGARGGRGSYLAIAILPPLGTRRSQPRDLAALVDHVLSRGAALLLLYDGDEHPELWIPDDVDCPHPRLLSLPCFHDGDDGDDGNDGDSWTIEPTAGGPEALANVIGDLWRGDLFYVGPDEGVQMVGVELMAVECWHCGEVLGAVTGLVFPDRAVGDWAALDWAYYEQLLDLAAIPEPLIPPLSAAVDGWRARGEPYLTVIRRRYSKTARCSYWAAECPGCGEFCGAFPTSVARKKLLHGLESRARGSLWYRPLMLDIPRQALRVLGSATEVSPHARPVGWFRADRGEAAPAPLTGSSVAAIGGQTPAAQPPAREAANRRDSSAAEIAEPGSGGRNRLSRLAQILLPRSDRHRRP